MPAKRVRDAAAMAAFFRSAVDGVEYQNEEGHVIGQRQSAALGAKPSHPVAEAAVAASVSFLLLLCQLGQIGGHIPKHQLFRVNFSRQRGQVMVSVPLPLGTRTVVLQQGQEKNL
jgi:hypothetical protein